MADDSTFVATNKYISQQIDDLASELDELLSNRRETEKNRSTISLIGFVTQREGNVRESTGHVAAHLKLPNFEKLLKVRLSSFDDEDEFEGNGRNRDGAQPREQKLGTSFGLARTFQGVQTLFRPRIEFRDPLVTSFLLKFSGERKFSIFQMDWRKKFFVHSVDGAGQSFAIDFTNTIYRFLVFRWFNEFQYLDRDHLFQVAQGHSLRYRLNDSMALSNTFVINSQNRELNPQSPQARAESFHLNNYQLLFSFSHNILRRVFHYQISPFWQFAKARSFKGEVGVQLRTEVIF